MFQFLLIVDDTEHIPTHPWWFIVSILCIKATGAPRSINPHWLSHRFLDAHLSPVNQQLDFTQIIQIPEISEMSLTILLCQTFPYHPHVSPDPRWRWSNCGRGRCGCRCPRNGNWTVPGRSCRAMRSKAGMDLVDGLMVDYHHTYAYIYIYIHIY